jgi:hypothetical protein
LVLVGAVLLAAGIGAKRFFPPQSYWSDEKAHEYVAASTSLKTIATGSIRVPSPASNPSLAAAQERFDRIQAELDRAVARRNYTTVALEAGGAVLSAVGVALFLRGKVTTKSASDDERPFVRSSLQ